MNEYIQEHGHSNPNSTDVKAVTKCENIGGYLCKYLSKTEQNENAIKGKVWDCSLNLKSAKRFTIEPDNQFFDRVELKVKKSVLKEVIGDRFRIVFGKPVDIFSCLSLFQMNKFDKWKNEIITYKRSTMIRKKKSVITPVVVLDPDNILKQMVFPLKVSNSIALNF